MCFQAWFGADQSPTEVELIAACERLTSEGVRLGITLLREIVKQFKGNIESLAAVKARQQFFLPEKWLQRVR